MPGHRTPSSRARARKRAVMMRNSPSFRLDPPAVPTLQSPPMGFAAERLVQSWFKSDPSVASIKDLVLAMGGHETADLDAIPIDEEIETACRRRRLTETIPAAAKSEIVYVTKSFVCADILEASVAAAAAVPFHTGAIPALGLGAVTIDPSCLHRLTNRPCLPPWGYAVLPSAADSEFLCPDTDDESAITTTGVRGQGPGHVLENALGSQVRSVATIIPTDAAEPVGRPAKKTKRSTSIGLRRRRRRIMPPKLRQSLPEADRIVCMMCDKVQPKVKTRGRGTFRDQCPEARVPMGWLGSKKGQFLCIDCYAWLGREAKRFSEGEYALWTEEARLAMRTRDRCLASKRDRKGKCQ